MKKPFLSYSCLLMALVMMIASFGVNTAIYSALFAGLSIFLLCFSLKSKAEEVPADDKKVAGEFS
jgi:heme O synthase-like polyprenyltransferase